MPPEVFLAVKAKRHQRSPQITPARVVIRRSSCSMPAVPVAKLDRAVLAALADKVFTPERLKEMLRELKARLKKAQSGQDD